uniref:Uncharacterized protein n=1 Tax=Setaria digitata TaxID=48799 RepID=A0A915PSX0_9BILA
MNNERVARRSGANSGLDMPTQDVETKSSKISDISHGQASSKSYTSKQSIFFSLTQRSDSEETQSASELDSRTVHSTETSSKAVILLSKKLGENISRNPSRKAAQKNREESLARLKPGEDKIKKVAIRHSAASPTLAVAVTQDLPDFAHEEASPKAFKKSNDMKSEVMQRKQSEDYFIHPTQSVSEIGQGFSRRKMTATGQLKMEKISCRKAAHLSQRGEPETIQSVATTIPMKETCRLMPHWWSNQKEFVEGIIGTTRYFQALNSSFNQTGERFEIFMDEKTIEILKPFNGQLFVIFGCVVLAFPILLLLMFLRCMSEEEDLMEEAMFDLVEISIFCVFSVIQFYMSSAAEIRAVMDSMCIRYLERSIRIDGFLVDTIIYESLAAGSFPFPCYGTCNNAEQVESRKYLQMAACLHYDKPLKYMSKSVMEGVFAEPALRDVKRRKTKRISQK